MSIASHFFIATPEEAARNDGLENASEDQLAVFYKVLFTGIEPIYKILANADCPEFELVLQSHLFLYLYW